MTTIHPLLGQLEPDPIAQFLGTGYQRFNSPLRLVDGLCKMDGKRLDILAVASRIEGEGNVRRFFSDAKEQFDTICVWILTEPILEAALARWGFSRETEIQTDGEALHGYRWDRNC